MSFTGAQKGLPDSPRRRYLSDDEARRLVNACNLEFRPMVQAALLTGRRYGELAALRSADFNRDAGTLQVRASKLGRARHVHLTDEGRHFEVWHGLCVTPLGESTPGYVVVLATIRLIKVTSH
jgi:integrase